MSNFGLEPVEFTDFSGGETDYYLLGDKKRYQFATNFLVNADRKLETRPGSAPFDLQLNHLLPNAPVRVGAFFTFNQGRELLVQQAQNLYFLKNSWKPIVGPEGSPAAPRTGAYDPVSFAEWNGHTYFTSAGGGRPGKIYRNPEGEFQVRTVGLPLPAPAAIFTNDSLLSTCLRLANDLRQSMVSHIKDTANLHAAIDKYSLSYFEAQVWAALDGEYPGPLPAPTPAPAATDKTSLYALILAMEAAYGHHGKEAGTAAFYHHQYTVQVAGNAVSPPKGPFKLPTGAGTPGSLENAAARLNELRQRWYWHRLGLFTHSSLNDITAVDLYPVAAGEIQYVSLDNVPYVQPNYSEVLRYANYLKDLYNQHVSLSDYGADWRGVPAWGGSNWHSQALNTRQYTLCTAKDATDLNSAYLLIYWIWALYGAVHFADAKIAAHTNITMDTTAGSANVTDVKDEAAAAVTLPVGSFVVASTAIFTDANAKNQHVARVTASAAGTATFDKLLVGTVGDAPCQYSTSIYHGGWDGKGALKTYTTSQVVGGETPDPSPGSGLAAANIKAVPATLKAWIDFGATTFNLLSSHMQDAKVHPGAQFPSDFLWGNGPFYKPQIATYSYAAVYKYLYKTENGVQFESESEPVFFGNVETAKQYPVNTELATGLPTEDTSVFANAGGFVSTHVETVASAVVQNLPRLQNDLSTNYDVNAVTVEIFRTQDGGSDYFLLDEVANGVYSFTDVVSDTNPTSDQAVTSDRAPIYTTGGEVAHAQAPEAKFLHIFDNTAYYGYVTDTGQVFPNRIVQSIPNAPDIAPADFSLDLPEEVVGISSCKTNVVALCKKGLYRVTGGFNNLGQGSLGKETIADEIGCVSTKSIVRTKHGIFFAGTDGFYFTDGFQYIKISIDRDLSYKLLVQNEVQASRITAAYDEIEQRIWWSVMSSPSSKDVDYSWVFHINFGVKPAGVFTSAANGTYWSPTAMAFHLGVMYRGDRRGVLFVHDKKFGSDPKTPFSGSYDDFIGIDQWGTVHVPYVYRSCATDFGSMSNGNWVTKLKFMGKNAGNSAIQARTIANNNYTDKKKPVFPMFYEKNVRWGDALIEWGGATPWKYDGEVNFNRRMPHGNLRAQTKQIELVPARVGVYRYDAYPEESYVDLDYAHLHVTLQHPSGYEETDFPLDVVGMYIAFEDDGYVNEFEIVGYLYDQLTIADPNNLLTEDLVSQKWVIRGYLKESAISMLGFAVLALQLGDRGSPAVAVEGEGENA
jgi:hypothetical protein